MRAPQPLGNAGFVLNDVVAVMPANPATGDKESTLKIQKVTVEELDFDRMKDHQGRRGCRASPSSRSRA